MAGEGTRYLKGRASKTSKKLQVNTGVTAPVLPNETLAKLNNDRTEATFVDGTVKAVTPFGSPGSVSFIVGAQTESPIAYGQTFDQYVVDGKITTAYLMERYNLGTTLEKSSLRIRRIGDTTNSYPVPLTGVLQSVVEDSTIVAGFSSNGKNFFVAGARSTDLGENVWVDWAIYKNFSLSQGQLSWESEETGSVNLSEKFQSEIRPQFDTPLSGWEETETRGLAGDFRARDIYAFYPSGSAGSTVTPEEIAEFKAYLIEFFELTPEDIDILFPPETATAYTLSYLLAQTNQFKPAYDIEFHDEIAPYSFERTPGVIQTDTITYDGFRQQDWLAHDHVAPVFMEITFAFNNNADGVPILDIVTSYQSTVVYYIRTHSWETVAYNLSTFSGSTATLRESFFTKADSETYVYTFPDNLAFDGSQTVNFDIIDPSDGTSRHNYHFRTEGTFTDINDGTAIGWTEYYPVLWFDDYAPTFMGPGELPRCDAWTTNPFFGAGPQVNNPDCAYFKFFHNGVGFVNPPVGGLDPACDAAFFDFFGGIPNYAILQTYYPPDTGQYTVTYFNGTAQINPDVGSGPVYYPSVPFQFFTYYPWIYEPHFGGYFIHEDNNGWGEANPSALVTQFGRGVMTAKGVNTDSPTYSYIDRPPAVPNNYDHLYNPYFGVNGSRAIVSRDTHFNAYAYSPEYVQTTNQIVGLQPPDTYTDVYFIDQGTWPFFFNSLKAVNSKDFLQYWEADGKQYLEEIHVEIGESTEITFGKFKSGNIVTTSMEPGIILDYVFKNGDYTD